MAHPFIVDSPSLWDARAIDGSDGDPVTLWEPTLNGVDFAATGSVYLDLSALNGEAAIRLTTTSDRVQADSMGSNGSSYALAFSIMFSAPVPGYTQMVWSYDFANQPNYYYVSASPSSYLRFSGDKVTSVLLQVDVRYTVVIRFEESTSTMSAWVNASKELSSESVTYSEYNFNTLRFRGANYHIQALSYVPALLSDAECVQLGEYIETFDDDYSGGVTRTVQIGGLPIGSRVQMYERPHPQRSMVDFTGIDVADLDGVYFTFATLESSSETLRYCWFDLDSGSSDPAPASRTGTEASVSTGDDPEDIAGIVATALNALTYCSVVAVGAVVYIENTENGEVEAAADVDTGATITEIAAGGTGTDKIDEIASTTSETVETLQYLISRPYEASIAAYNSDFVTSWLRVNLGLAGYTIGAGAMLSRTDDAYRADNDPSWTHGSQWAQDDANRELALSTAGRLDQLYFEVKDRQATDTDGLQPEPFLEPADYGNAFTLRNCDWDGATSRSYIRDDGFRILDADGDESEAWACVKSGSNELNGTTYYVTSPGGTPVDAAASGEVNKVVQIRDGSSLDVSFIELLARPWDSRWARTNTEELGATYLDGQQYYFGLLPVTELSPAPTSRATVATWTDVTVTFGAAVEATRDWDVSIDGGGRTGSQVVERCRYLTDEDQTATLDGTAGRVYTGQELRLPFTGTGGFTEGLIVTGGTSGASARIVAAHSDALTLRRTSASHSLEFVSGETITDTSTGTGTAGTAEAYAKPSREPLCWLEGETLVGARGVWIDNASGTIRLTDAEGSTYSPAQSTTLTIHAVDASDGSDIENARVYLIAASGGDIAEGTVLVNGLTDANGEINYTAAHSNPQPVSGRVRKATTTPLYQEGPILGVTITPGTNQTVAVPMVADE